MKINDNLIRVVLAMEFGKMGGKDNKLKQAEEKQAPVHELKLRLLSRIHPKYLHIKRKVNKHNQIEKKKERKMQTAHKTETLMAKNI